MAVWTVICKSLIFLVFSLCTTQYILMVLKKKESLQPSNNEVKLNIIWKMDWQPWRCFFFFLSSGEKKERNKDCTAAIVEETKLYPSFCKSFQGPIALNTNSVPSPLQHFILWGLPQNISQLLAKSPLYSSLCTLHPNVTSTQEALSFSYK